MISAFIDSSVFFAACLSPKGASNAILQASVQGEITLVISDTVRAETERNLASLPRRAAEAVLVFQQLLDAVPFVLSNPTTEEIAEAATYTVLKDAPIVAAAKRAKVDYLASFDRKHLVGVPAVAHGSDLSIVLPETLLAAIRSQQP